MDSEDLNPREKLKICRIRLHMTQKEFAKAFGLSFVTVRNWESDSRSMPKGPVALLIELLYADPFSALRVMQK